MTPTQRCAECGARLATTDQWCSLCHAPLPGSEVPIIPPQQPQISPTRPVPPRTEAEVPGGDQELAQAMLGADVPRGLAVAEIFRQKPVQWGIMILGPLIIIGVFFLLAAIVT